MIKTKQSDPSNLAFFIVSCRFEFLSQREQNNKNNLAVSYIPEVTCCEVLSPITSLRFIYAASKYVVTFLFLSQHDRQI